MSTLQRSIEPATDTRSFRAESSKTVPLTLLVLFLILLTLIALRPNFVTHFDASVRDAVQRRSHAPDNGRSHWPWVNRIANLGGPVPAIPVMAAVAGTYAWLRHSWRPVLAALAAYAVLGGAVIGLKIAVARPGPEQTTLNALLGYFPSGHTADTVMCYGTCALIAAAGLRGSRAGRRACFIIATAMVLLAAAVGFSLVWLDYHWVSDVLGSYLLCGAALFWIARIVRIPSVLSGS